ncbi:MAG TPA: RHS repeat-associated core domain-containing protein [Symbiobacteriaceae bacterium]
MTYASGQPGSYTVKHGYDAYRRLVSVTPPDGNKTYFFYTNDSRLASENPVNAVVNASFEVDGDGNNLPDYWVRNSSSATTAVLGSTPAAPFGGKHFDISPAAPSTTANSWGVYVSPSIFVDLTQTYQLSGYMRAVQNTGSQTTVFSLLAYDGPGSYLGEFGRMQLTGNNQNWTRYSSTLPVGTLPAGTATVQVKVAASNLGGSGTSYFDGVQLEEGPAVTDFVAPTTFTVDPVNLATAMYDGSGKKVKWTYSDSGNPLTETADPTGLNYQAQFTWTPDKPNPLERYKDPVAVATAGEGTKYSYDPSGNLRDVIDGMGNASHREYNSVNDLITYTDPNAYGANGPPQVKFTYDGQRNAAAIPDRQGMVSARSVDLSSCSGCVLGETPALSLADNLLTNGGFERSASGAWPDAWTVSGGTGSWDSSTVYSGARAFRVTPSGQTVTVTYGTNLPVSDGASYVLSLYVRADSPDLGAGAQGKLEFLDANGVSLASAYSNLFKRAGEWNRSAVVATAPPGASQVRINLIANPALTSGSVYFDNVQFEKAPSISTFNLLDNPGFERGTTGPDFWQSSNQPFNWSSALPAVFAGTKSVSLTNASATSGFEPSYVIRLDAGRSLTLSAFVKTDNLQNGSAYIKLKWYDAQQNFIGESQSKTKRSGSSDWTRVYVQCLQYGQCVQPPAGTQVTYVKPSLVVETSGGATGTAYFDAIRLEEAPVATEFQYGAVGQPKPNNWVTQATNPVGDFVNFEYNAAGFTTKVTPNGDAGKAVSYTPDNLQRLQTVGLPNGLTARYGYTGNGLLNTVTHSWTDGTAQTAVTQYDYNRCDLLRQITDPLGRKTTFSYDAAGNLASLSQPNGTVISLDYDAANRVSQRSFTGTKYTFLHDGNNNLTRAADGTSTWGFDYDAIDRLKTVTNVVGKVDYGYDKNSSLTSRVMSVGGATFTNALKYDAMDRLLRVEDGAGNFYARFSYDERGQLVKWVTAGNKLYSVMEYDGAGRLVKQQNLKVDGTLLAAYAYTYDDQGNRLTETVTTTTGTVTRSFSYDPVGQLLSDGTTAYTYTPQGNRKTRVSGGVSENYCYDAADQLLYRGPNACGSATNVSYDPNGNMTQNASGPATWDYQYDAENHLIQVKQNGNIIATYTYDFAGRRASKTANGSKRVYHYDGLSNRVLYEIDANTGAVVVWYTWAGDRVVSQTRGGVTYYYLYNAHGDVVGLADGTGMLQNSYAYDSWGKPDPANTTETVENPYRYAGYRWDAETGLYYLNARYYDPDLGRLLMKDMWRGSVWDPLSQNANTYVQNDSVNLVDPTGMIPIDSMILIEDQNGYAAPRSPRRNHAETLANSEGDISTLVYQKIPLERGWEADVHPANTNTKTKRHVHIRGPNGEHGSWNDDGSVHDAHAQKGYIPKGIRKLAKGKTGIPVPLSLEQTDVPEGLFGGGYSTIAPDNSGPSATIVGLALLGAAWAMARGGGGPGLMLK